MNFREAMTAFGSGNDVQFKYPKGDWEDYSVAHLEPLEWRVMPKPKYKVLFAVDGEFFLSELYYTSAQAFISAANDNCMFVKLIEETRK